MWFVFPQLAGLGRSATAQRFAIADLAEARAYLAHPTLGPRLLAATEAVAAVPPPATAEDVLGGIDAIKLRSSMTLFARAAGDDDEPAAQVFRQVLDRYFDGRTDPATEALLAE